MIDATPTQVQRALAIVGLDSPRDAHRPVRGYSQGMRQRLGIAMALLPVPELLILDEPTNGLDPAGIHEMRELIRRMPEQEGVTVFLSSHLLGEIEQLATHIGIIDRGHIIFEGAPDELRAAISDEATLVTDRAREAQAVLQASGWQSSYNGNGHLTLRVNGQSDVAVVNRRLVESGIPVYGLHMAQPSLEDIFLALTANTRESSAGSTHRLVRAVKGADHEQPVARPAAQRPSSSSGRLRWAWPFSPRSASAFCSSSCSPRWVRRTRRSTSGRA